MDVDRAQVEIVSKREDVYRKSNVILKVGRPSEKELSSAKEGQIIIGYISPSGTGAEIISGNKVTALRSR